MKKLLLPLLISLSLYVPAIAQTGTPAAGTPVAPTDEAAVKQPILRLFEAMKRADTTGLAAQFAPNARLESVVNRDGQVSVRVESISGFITSIAKAQAGALDERLSGWHIETDGDLATVWTPYEFYYQGKFSHAGANAFTLVRLNNQWRILGIIDTRRKAK